MDDFWTPGQRAILAFTRMDVMHRELEQAVMILKKGGVIAFPTDTVYGLGADAFNACAVERIYEIKGRPRVRQFPLLIAEMESLSVLSSEIPEMARYLTARFWPGGLTIVLPRAASLPAHLGTGPGIAVRIPDHPVCHALIRGLGRPVIGTSANISGHGPALTAAEVRNQLEGKIDFIIDGGTCPGGQESTVVEITQEVPVILRQGIIPAQEIDRAYQEYLEVSNEAAHRHRR